MEVTYRLPSDKILKQKQQVVTDLTGKIKDSVAGVLVDYKGITVDGDTKLRKELREAGVEYSVIKNSLLKFATKEAGLDGLHPVLEGATALAISPSDHVAAAKILTKFADDNKEFFSIKAGYIDGEVIGTDDIKRLGKLPSREVLIAQTLAGFNAPIAGFANVLNANLRGLAIVLNAIAEKQSA